MLQCSLSNGKNDNYECYYYKWRFFALTVIAFTAYLAYHTFKLKYLLSFMKKPNRPNEKLIGFRILVHYFGFYFICFISYQSWYNQMPSFMNRK